MATTAIVGEKVGMSQKWVNDKVVPVTVLRVEPMRIVQVKTTERDGYTALQVTYGHRDAKKLTKPEAGPLRQGRGRAGQAPRRAAPRLGRRLRGRPGDQRRHRCRRQQGRRHRGQPGQGLRRHDEAPQLQGPGRQPRQPQAPPGAGRDRFVRVPRPGVQGPEDGRPHGPRAGHHAQPGGRRGRPRAQPAAASRARCRAPTAASSSSATPSRARSPDRHGLDHRQERRRQGRRQRRARRRHVFGVQPNVAADAPGRHRPARRPPRRHAEHQDPQPRCAAAAPSRTSQKGTGNARQGSTAPRTSAAVASPTVRSRASTARRPRRR